MKIEVKVRGKDYPVIVEKEGKTLIGHVPGMQGAHSQGVGLKELKYMMKDVIELILDVESDKVKSRSWRAKVVKLPYARPATY